MRVRMSKKMKSFLAKLDVARAMGTPWVESGPEDRATADALVRRGLIEVKPDNFLGYFESRLKSALTMQERMSKVVADVIDESGSMSECMYLDSLAGVLNE